MSKKVLDWGAVAQPGFDDKRRERLGIPTEREMFAKAYEAEAKHEEEARLVKAMEPLLKAKLVEFMTERKPIRVHYTFSNPTETLGGLQKSEDSEEDDFYYNGGRQKQDASMATANASFQEVMESVPAGIDLIFKSHDKQLGQFVFKGSNGHEYAIYTQPNVMFQQAWIKNPGYYGLLFNTQIRQELGD